MSTPRDFKAIKRGDVSSVLPMITMKANTSWMQLPPHTRAWRSQNDLVAEGVNFTVTKATKYFDPELGNKFSTYLMVALDNFYFNRMEMYRAKERCEEFTVSYERDWVQMASGKWMPVAKYIGKTQRYLETEDRLITKIDAERAFIKVYEGASSSLRKYLIRWLLQPKTTKFKDGTEYRNAKREFKRLAKPAKLSYELCQYIVRDNMCRLALCHTILFEKRFLTYRYKTETGRIRDCEEWALLPLALTKV